MMQQKNDLLDDKAFRPTASIQLLDHSTQSSESTVQLVIHSTELPTKRKLKYSKKRHIINEHFRHRGKFGS